jgi:type III secretion protein T
MELEDAVKMATAVVLVGAVSSMRALGLAYIFPLFSWTRIGGPIRLAFAVAVSLPITLGNLDRSAGLVDASMFLTIGLLFKEFLIGALTGLFLGVPFWGAQAAGDSIELFRGASAANLHDPMNAVETTIFGALTTQLALGLFVTAGGFFALLRALFETFSVWPPFAPFPNLTLESASAASSIVTNLLWIGVIVCVPLFIIMLIADLTMMFVGRGSRLPMFDLSVKLKNLAIVLLAPIYVTFFWSYVERDWGDAITVFRRFLGLP